MDMMGTSGNHNNSQNLGDGAVVSAGSDLKAGGSGLKVGLRLHLRMKRS